MRPNVDSDDRAFFDSIGARVSFPQGSPYQMLSEPKEALVTSMNLLQGTPRRITTRWGYLSSKQNAGIVRGHISWKPPLAGIATGMIGSAAHCESDELSTRIYVGNLNFQARLITGILSRSSFRTSHGEVTFAQISRSSSRTSRPYFFPRASNPVCNSTKTTGFVEMSNGSEDGLAISALNGQECIRAASLCVNRRS